MTPDGYNPGAAEDPSHLESEPEPSEPEVTDEPVSEDEVAPEPSEPPFSGLGGTAPTP